MLCYEQGENDDSPEVRNGGNAWNEGVFMNISELSLLGRKLPGHLVCDKRLWLGMLHVDIDHIDNDLGKPLDYIKAFKMMIKLKEKKEK